MSTRPLATTFGMCLEYLVVLDRRLHRHQFWLAYQSLCLARVSLLELFTAGRRQWTRPYHVFEAEATDELKRHFGQTLPQHDLVSLQQAYVRLLDLIMVDLETISAGQLALTSGQRQLLADLRARQMALKLGR